MSTGSQSHDHEDDVLDQEAADTPQKVGMLERLYQNREFQRLRTEARSTVRPLNTNTENFHDFIDDMAGSLQEINRAPNRPDTPEDTEEKQFIDIAERGGAQLLSTVSALEDLSAEHSRPANAQNDAWFNQEDSRTGRVSGRRRYQNTRDMLLSQIGSLNDVCDQSGIREVAPLRREVRQLSSAAETLITSTGDFPGGHESISAFCESVRTFVSRMDAIRQAVESRRAASAMTTVQRAAADHIILDDAFIGQYQTLMTSLTANLQPVVNSSFWQAPEMQLANANIIDMARDLSARATSMRENQTTLDFMQAQQLYVQLQELIDAMNNELRAHVNRPPEFTIEHDASTVQKTVTLMSDGLRSRYRNAVLAGVLAVTAAGGMLYSRNSGGPDNAAKTEVAQPADTPANTPTTPVPNTANPPVGPANAPTVAATPKGTAELGGGRVEVAADNFVFTLRPSVKAAQAWVGKPGEEPVRLALQIVNGKATFQIPVELKGQNWIGVQLDTFESGAWTPGTYKKLELK